MLLSFRPHAPPAAPPPDDAGLVAGSMIFAVGLFLFAVLVVFVIAFLVARYEKNITGGLYFWQRSALARNGRQGSAVVLDALEISWSGSGRLILRLMDLALEVQAPGMAPWRTSLRYKLTFSDQMLVATGKNVPVRFDPASPSRIMIDWGLIHQREKAGEQHQHAAQEARHAAMLDPTKRP